MSVERVKISWYKIFQSIKNKPKPPKVIKSSNVINPKHKIKLSPKRKQSLKKKTYSKRTFICTNCKKKLILQVKKGTNVTQCPICNSPALSL